MEKVAEMGQGSVEVVEMRASKERAGAVEKSMRVEMEQLAVEVKVKAEAVEISMQVEMEQRAVEVKG